MEVKLIQETCCRKGCNVLFWIPESFQQILLSEKTTFYCPHGHGMNYTGESDRQKVKRLEMQKETAARALAEKDAELAVKDIEMEKLKKKLLRLKKKHVDAQ